MTLIEIPLTKYGVLIPILNALSSFSIFNEERTNLSSEQLPFFENYKLLIAQSFSCIPPVTMHYLWNPQTDDVIKLDGTRESVFDNLNKLRLTLNTETAVPYVRFVLGNVQSEQGALRLRENIDEVSFSVLPSDLQRTYLEQKLRPATVVDEGETFFICCMVIYGDTLFEAEIRLEKNGLFDFVSEQQVGDKMRCLRPIFLE